MSEGTCASVILMGTALLFFHLNSAVPIKITDAHVPSDIDSKTIEIITRFEQSLVDTLTSVHKSGKDELIHQLIGLELELELDLKLTKLDSSIVNSFTTMHNQEK
jgi:hypothetical protein